MRQFKEHENHRVYLAIALGTVEPLTIDTVLVDDRGDGKRGSTTRGEEGKQAVTHVRPLETTGKYTLVECRLETGRTHQIRIHLAEQGHPVCGDKVYHGPPGVPPVKDASGATRQALHAAELGFEHPISGKPLKFSTGLPKDLAKLWERLKTAGT
jgi:23S rRNA pseudouridine1911/1915/1917 synthase